MKFNQLVVKKKIAEICRECSPLLEHLRLLGHFQWIPNPGNAGDGLITIGTRRLFNQANLKYHQTSRHEIVSGMPAVYGGGGAWCRAFGIASEIVQEIAPLAGSVVILPSTFELNQIKRISNLPNLFFYGRDHASVELVSQLGLAVEFAHDLAFGCPIPASTKVEENSVLAAFRKDRIGTPNVPGLESIKATVARDFSREGNHLSEDLLMQFVSGFQTVHTDRLHVAIAATMLGRETILYPNGDQYKKNADLYQSTLARFENCRLAA